MRNLNYIRQTPIVLNNITKRTFFFDYVAHVSTNGDGHLRGVVNTEEIEVWDEEHATLLFKEKHLDTPFDPPY